MNKERKTRMAHFSLERKELNIYAQREHQLKLISDKMIRIFDKYMLCQDIKEDDLLLERFRELVKEYRDCYREHKRSKSFVEYHRDKQIVKEKEQ